jgi:hypothetical protein
MTHPYFITVLLFRCLSVYEKFDKNFLCVRRRAVTVWFHFYDAPHTTRFKDFESLSDEICSQKRPVDLIHEIIIK